MIINSILDKAHTILTILFFDSDVQVILRPKNINLELKNSEKYRRHGKKVGNTWSPDQVLATTEFTKEKAARIANCENPKQVFEVLEWEEFLPTLELKADDIKG